ncbi:MAG: radical SAM protein [Firmicutes bacterium]|nr:radical SAM protein [Bacillota bacterium]
MKASRFNIITDIGNGDILLYNTLKNTFVKIDQDLYDVFQKITTQGEKENIDESDPHIAAAIMDYKKGGFIVEDDLNENDYLRLNDIIRRFSDYKRIGLTIAPTMDCNFSCIYCYESDKKKCEYMSREVEDKIIKYVDENLEPYGALKVTWFGGEPLLAVDTIYRLSDAFMEITEKKKSRYYATILTNGYLLTPEVVTNLKKYGVDGAQVTLDGPPEYHDRVRCLKNGEGTFDRIVDNIKKMDYNFMISVLTNIGKDNVEMFPTFLDILEERGIRNRIVLSIAPLQPREYLCRQVNNAVFDPEEFSKVYVRLVEMLVDRRVGTDVVPKSYESQCASISQMGMLIGPDGCLYKCWDVIGNYSECVGRIGQKVKLLDGSYRWLAWDVFKNEECRNCSVLPLCMGGCPRKILVKDNILNRQNHCSHLKYNMPELLKILYKQYKDVKKTG